MATLFTQAEIEARVALARPPLTVIDRRFDLALEEKDELQLGIQDVVGRTLNSDVDAVFHLVGLAARNNAAAARKLLQRVRRFMSAAQAGSQATSQATPRVEMLLDLLDQASGVGPGRQRRVRESFGTTVAAYARSSRTAEGRFTVGRDVGAARAQAMLEIEPILKEGRALLGDTVLFVDALKNYRTVDMTAASRERHIMYARALLEQHLGRPAYQQSEAILDAVVANALLSLVFTQENVESAKASGSPPVSALVDGTRTVTLTEVRQSAPIRVGDLVLASDLAGTSPLSPVGYVSWVRGLEIEVDEGAGSPLPGTAVNQDTAQYRVEVVARGLASHRDVVPQLADPIATLQGLLAGEARAIRAFMTYAEAGVVTPALTNAITALMGAVSALEALFGQYVSSRVGAAELLLHHLEDERLGLVASVLTELRFSALQSLSGTLSSQGEAEYLMEELLQDAVAGAGSDTFDLPSQFGDFFRSGVADDR